MNAAFRRCALFAMLAISCPLVSLGAEPPYSITISTTKDVAKVGSEVQVVVTLKNTSEHEIKIERSPATDRGEQGHDVEVIDENGATVPETKYYRAIRGKDTSDGAPLPLDKSIPRLISVDEGSMIVFTLKPGETLQDGILLNKIVDLTRAGKYTVRIRRRDNTLKTPVVSNAITVTLIN